MIYLILIHTQILWHAVAFVLKELCDRAPCSSPDIKPAWRVIDATFDEWKPPPDSAGTLMYDSVKKLLAKALSRRDHHNRASAENSVSRSVSVKSSSGLSPKCTNMPSSDPTQQAQQFQGKVPFEFPGNYNDPMFNVMATGMDLGIGASVGVGGGLLEDQQFLGYDTQIMPPLEELISFLGGSFRA